MKKWFVGFIFFSVFAIYPMQLVQKVYDWRDERRADCFLQNFGSKTGKQLIQEVQIFSSGAVVEKYLQSQKERELFKGAVILTLLPYDMQKKVLEEIDIMFVDHAAVNGFLNRPIAQALSWVACINKKMGNKLSYVVGNSHRSLLGEKGFTRELSRGQIFELSLDEIILFDEISDYVEKQLGVGVAKKFKKTELIALEQLIEKGHMSKTQAADYTVQIVIDHPWNHRLKLLKKVMVNIVFPLFTSYCAHQMLVGIDPLEGQKRITNNALQELESCGQGPYLKFEFDYSYTSQSIFKYFLMKLCDMGIVCCVYLKDLNNATIKDLRSIDRLFGFLYDQTVPGLICLIVICCWIRSMLFGNVKVGEFKYLPAIELVYNMVILFLGQNYLCLPLLKDDTKSSDSTTTETIRCSEISQCLQNKWITIK